jgi:hypothetical protein
MAATGVRHGGDYTGWMARASWTARFKQVKDRRIGVRVYICG